MEVVKMKKNPFVQGVMVATLGIVITKEGELYIVMLTLYIVFFFIYLQ